MGLLSYRKVVPLVLALGALMFAVSPAGADSGPHPSFVAQEESIDELSQLSGEEFEIGYINRIVPHHQSALAMSQIIQQKAPTQQLRNDAAMMIEEQQSEIELLTGYLSSTYGQEVEPDPRFVMPDSMMQELRDATPEMAEIMFLNMIREHHQSAIDLGELVLEKTDTQLLLDQATTMIDSQRTQQDQFAGYLSDWYGIDALEPTGDMQAAMEYAMSITMDMPGLPNTGGGGTASDRDGGNPVGLLMLIVSSLAVLAVGAGYLLTRQRLS